MDMIQKEASFVLIDMRSGKETKQGHIKGAVSIPEENLEAGRHMFPKDMAAPIILYSGDSIDTSAFDIVRKWGYKNLSVLNGGIVAWQSAGGTLTAGEASTTIEYVKRTPRNEVGIDEFRTIVETQPADTVILDVRNADTTAKGTLAGAVTIPLDALEARVGELPRDKEIVIHCNTGIMAGMAQKTLGARGYRTRILNAVIQVAPDGSFEISEK